MHPTVAIALSGGVDSLAAALILRERGVALLGLHFTTGPPPESGAVDPRRIAETASRLGIPLHLCDLSRPFRERVIAPFVSAYAQGLTPNPCLLCNAAIKFGVLLDRARALGAESLATGHYARIGRDPQGRPLLQRGLDRRKEQSYFLARLTAGQLARAVFPLGERTKGEARALVAAAGLAPAAARESQDICFIGGQSCARFLEHRAGLQPRPGAIVDLAGRELGRHHGLFRYTVGQRRGLACPSARPYYVVRLDPQSNQVVVGAAEDLERDACRLQGLNWIAEPPPGPATVMVRVRYRSPAVAATLQREGDGALLRFHRPQRAVAPGQAAVFYQRERVIGSGWIAAPQT